jgi:hypothetical protein
MRAQILTAIELLAHAIHRQTRQSLELGAEYLAGLDVGNIANFDSAFRFGHDTIFNENWYACKRIGAGKVR